MSKIPLITAATVRQLLHGKRFWWMLAFAGLPALIMLLGGRNKPDATVLDFFSDLVVPCAVKYKHEFDYVLVPLEQPPPDESEEDQERRRVAALAFHEAVKSQAEAFRKRVNEGDPAEVE